MINKIRYILKYKFKNLGKILKPIKSHLYASRFTSNFKIT